MQSFQLSVRRNSFFYREASVAQPNRREEGNLGNNLVQTIFEVTAPAAIAVTVTICRLALEYYFSAPSETCPSASNTCPVAQFWQ